MRLINKRIILFYTSENFSVSFKKWFKSPLTISGLNQKITEYYENDKIKRIWHSGTDEFRKGKKTKNFIQMGKLKLKAF